LYFRYVWAQLVLSWRDRWALRKDYRALEVKIAGLKRIHAEELVRVKGRINEEKQALRDVMDRLSSVKLYNDHQRYRVVYEIDPTLFASALMRGNDQIICGYIGAAVGHQVEQAILACNIMRPDSHVFQRG